MRLDLFLRKVLSLYMFFNLADQIRILDGIVLKNARLLAKEASLSENSVERKFH